MMKIKRILVPTDFSEGAETAAAVARQLAVRFNAEVDLIHVLPALKHFMRFLSSDMDAEFTDMMISNSKEHLEKSLMNLDEENRGEYFIKIDRKPHEAITQHLANRDYDLVVVGAKGEHKTKLRRGGTTRQIIRNSKAPVLTVTDTMTYGAVKRILVPTDASELSFTALSRAVIMADAFGADLTLLYVYEMHGGMMMDGTPFIPEKIQKDKLYEDLIRKLQKYLEKNRENGLHLIRGDELFNDRIEIRKKDSEGHIGMKTEILNGFSAHYEIESFASGNSDLVVMATHGYSGFAHMFIGSVTEKVLQYLDKPVLTVRPSEHEFKRSGKKEQHESGIDPLP